MNTNRKTDTYFLLLLISIAFVRIWFGTAYRIYVQSGQVYDDALFLQLAYSIREGNWLGAYTNLTLVKYPLFSVWLALNNLAGVPLLQSQSILYSLAGFFLVWQLKHWDIRRTWLVAFYAAYLFNPFVETRVLREGVYSSAAVFVIASFLWLYQCRERSRTEFVVKAFIAGVFLAVFWLLREEGLWLVPLLTAVAAHHLYSLYAQFRGTKELLPRIAISLLPLVVLVLAINVLCAINYYHYGVYVTVDQKSSDFTRAYGALLRVQHQNGIRSVQVPMDVRSKLYEVSPAFRELMPYIDGDLGNRMQRDAWIRDTCVIYPESCPDYGGTWFMWAFRDAVSFAGYYTSAPVANAYYGRLTSEITAACDSGKISCGPQHSSTIPPFQTSDIPILFTTFRNGLKYLFTVPVRSYVLGEEFSKASPRRLSIWHEFTHERVLPLEKGGKEDFTTLTSLDEFKLSVLRRILALYRLLFPATLYIIVIGFVLNLSLALARRNGSFQLTLATGILFSLIARLVLLSYIDFTMFPAFHMWQAYLVPFYPLIIALLFLVLMELARNLESFCFLPRDARVQ